MLSEQARGEVGDRLLGLMEEFSIDYSWSAPPLRVTVTGRELDNHWGNNLLVHVPDQRANDEVLIHIQPADPERKIDRKLASDGWVTLNMATVLAMAAEYCRVTRERMAAIRLRQQEDAPDE